ncbi:MAG: tellurite resistance TerB family protein [Deltaproteobacteria bacterium]|nr:tellurite resistance TerB family protein [Deltaproteobacteria bacterium]
MNTKFLLEQLLGNSTDHSKNNSSLPNSRQNIPDDLSSILTGKGGAALAGGALGLLLGSKSGRKMGGKVLKYGGLAVIGTLAYKAYQNHQKQDGKAGTPPIQPLGQLSPSQEEAHSKAILIALIAASKADGHIDGREREMIDSEVRKITDDPQLQRWFETELAKPLDPAEVAKHSADEAMATEMYLASLLAIDEQNFMEKAYLGELARQLNIPPGLQAELERQAKKASELA